ncbi:MAG: ribbon-helix-helix protein, CopG family [Sulfurimonadaceae bacterium]|jgi:metal-responsive CopG/Arc/MetJ family transcriptional regulator|nr:ribbon-helix-helix protein, CopG family [Arcobacteraceae bacterium]
MHTITLKADDNFFKTLNELVSKLGTSRSSLIRNAVINYKEMLEKEQLKEQIKKASLKVRNESIQITNEFDNTLEDGLDHV